jgi:hypothetical protein
VATPANDRRWSTAPRNSDEKTVHSVTMPAAASAGPRHIATEVRRTRQNTSASHNPVAAAATETRAQSSGGV